jgi:putative membrane protein insertion efficiency factor
MSSVSKRAFETSRAGLLGLAIAALLGYGVADTFLKPPRQVTARIALLSIDGYRATISPLLAHSRLVICRFHPTCSAYGREAVARYGVPKGLLLAAGRVLRCHPFAKGGEDPVP